MDVKVIRSNKKTFAIQVNFDLSVTVRVPKRASAKDVDRILREKQPWIEKHLENMKKKKAQYENRELHQLTDAEIRELADQALDYIPGRVEYFSAMIGVQYGRITIRNQKTRNESFQSFLG